MSLVQRHADLVAFLVIAGGFLATVVMDRLG